MVQEFTDYLDNTMIIPNHSIVLNSSFTHLFLPLAAPTHQVSGCVDCLFFLGE